jgi:N6-L-threonylcarbamoyladenine synthase
MALVLGIETSCDDTGVAIYCSQNGLLANLVYTQTIHNEYGGVVPELASRDHIRRIIPLIKQCALEAKIKLANLDAIAYTNGPGLSGSLLVGAGVANGLAFSLHKPTIAIPHLEGHLLAPLLNNNNATFPFIALLVSGGHSQIIIAKQIGDYQIIGDTLDDAAGEAFDKCAKMLDLPYPGGKYIAQLAQQGKDIYNLPRPMINSNTLEMSFSGLKTAVLTLIKDLHQQNEQLTDTIKANIAKSIEEAISDVLVKKILLAIKQTGINKLVVSGGVSSNLTLRSKLDSQQHIQVFYPPMSLCTDNGAMIAYAGYMRLNQAKYDYTFTVAPRWHLSDL